MATLRILKAPATQLVPVPLSKNERNRLGLRGETVQPELSQRRAVNGWDKNSVCGVDGKAMD